MKKLIILVLFFVGCVSAIAQEINIDIHKMDRVRALSARTQVCIYEATRTFIALKHSYVGVMPFTNAMCKVGELALRKEANFTSDELWQKYYNQFTYRVIKAAITDIDPTITADWPEYEPK